MKEKTMTTVLAFIALALLSILLIILFRGSQGIQHVDICDAYSEGTCYETCPSNMLAHPTAKCDEEKEKCCFQVA